MKATLRLESENGEIYTAFDLARRTDSGRPMIEDSRSDGGKYKARFQAAVYGDINGGGPEYHFKTLNGNIYIRKAE